MIRFFRRYRKIIILVGLPLLLVIFLIPGSIQAIGDYSARRGRTLGTFVNLAGEEVSISSKVYEDRQRELAALTKGLPISILMLINVGDVTEAQHWLLLVQEAADHGLIGGNDDAVRLASDLGQYLAMASGSEEAIPADRVLMEIASNAQVNLRDARQALIHARAVQRLLELYAGASKISHKRLEAIADRLLQGVDAKVAVLQADPLAEGLPEPTEEALLAQFEKYKDVEPGQGEMGFGYRLPDRVQIEWLEVSPTIIRESLERNGRIDRLEVRKHWLKNKDQFKAPGAAPDHEATFEEVEPQVREAYVATVTNELLGEITRFAEGEFARRLRELPRAGIHYTLPEDWETRHVPLHELANQIGTRFNVTTPAYQKRADLWYAADEVSVIPGLGLASTTRFGASKRLADLVPLLKEFSGSEEIPVQEDVVGPTLSLGDGTIFLYRIIATDKARPAATLDEVRDKVIADLKRTADYERLAAEAEALRAEALAKGIEAFARAHDSIVIPQRNIGFAPDDSQLVATYRRNNTRFLPPVGRDEQAISAIVERGRAIITRLLTERLTVEDIPIEELTFTVPVPQKLALLVVQLSDLRPAVREDLASLSAPLQQILVREELGAQLDVFTLDAMSKRFQLDMGRDEETGEGDAAATETASTG